MRVDLTILLGLLLLPACTVHSALEPDQRLAQLGGRVSATIAQELVNLGVCHLGENRLQDALPKIDRIRGPVKWHFIGHLQKNKARKAARAFAMIESVDSIELGQKLADAADGFGVELDILVQVNVAAERQKSGLATEAIEETVRALLVMPGLNVLGLMTIAPIVDDSEDVRFVFAGLRRELERLHRDGILDRSACELSMGMSNDLEVAIEEGATMVRVGRALFRGVEDSEVTAAKTSEDGDETR